MIQDSQLSEEFSDGVCLIRNVHKLSFEFLCILSLCDFESAFSASMI